MQYAEHTNGICSNADDAADLIYKHRQFLLERMEREEGGVEWKRTAVFNHLQFMVRVCYSLSAFRTGVGLR